MGMERGHCTDYLSTKHPQNPPWLGKGQNTRELRHGWAQNWIDKGEVMAVWAVDIKPVNRKTEVFRVVGSRQAQPDKTVNAKLVAVVDGRVSHQDLDGKVLGLIFQHVSTKPDVGVTTHPQLINNSVLVVEHVADVYGMMASELVVVYIFEPFDGAFYPQTIVPELAKTLLW